MKLRDYQNEIRLDLKAEALRLIKLGFPAPKILCVLPTRSGKTVVFCDMAGRVIAAFFDKDGNLLETKRVLIITHRKEIFDQTVKKIAEFGMVAGQICTGKTLTKNPIQVAMVGTLKNLLQKQIKLKENGKFKEYNFVEKPDLIIWDEAHHCISESWKWVFAYYKDVMQIGFTATPVRLDNKPLGDIFQSLVVGKSTKWMIENYWLTDYRHKTPRNLLKNAKIKMRGKDFDKPSQVEKLTTIQAAADIIKYYKMFLDGLQTVVFCCNLKHADEAKIIFENAGYKTQIISSKTKNRTEIMQKYKSGEYPILISIDIISEGVDLPLCYGVIFLRLTASLSLYLQMISRCLTPIYADGYNIEIKEQRKIAMNKAKPYGMILDFVGNGLKHGKLDEHREWSLSLPPKKRKGKNEVKHMDCPCGASYFLGEVRICEYCGHDFEAHKAMEKKIEIEQLEGELIDIHRVVPETAESLAKTILDMKKYSNKRNMMLSHLHRSINLGERDIRAKLSAMCAGLEFKANFKHIIWQRLLEKYPEKLRDQ